MSLDQAARLLLCEEATVAEYLRAGLLPGLKFGRQWVIPRQAFLECLNALAIEQSTERRGRRAKPNAELVMLLKPVTRGRRRNVPPVLPTLPDAMHNSLNP